MSVVRFRPWPPDSNARTAPFPSGVFVSSACVYAQRVCLRPHSRPRRRTGSPDHAAANGFRHDPRYPPPPHPQAVPAPALTIPRPATRQPRGCHATRPPSFSASIPLLSASAPVSPLFLPRVWPASPPACDPLLACPSPVFPAPVFGHFLRHSTLPWPPSEQELILIKLN